ncbi:MAG TPA: DUF4012 domain-containing protein [Candidatus Paceibacterota bacterium]|nr:DUF4012 domain-containing protein [Candidatus Paceibacterota bacterium]
MPPFDKKPKKRLQFHRRDEEIDVNALAKTIGSEERDEALEGVPVPVAHRRTLPRGLVWAIVGLVVIFIVGFAISYYVIKGRVVREISSQVTTLQQGVADLQNLDPQSAQGQFQNLDSTPDLGGILSAFSFIFKGGNTAYQSFADMSKWLSALAGHTDSLQASTFTLFSTGNGSGFIADLTNIKNDLANIDADSNSLGAVIPSLGSGATNQLAAAYLPLKAQVQGVQEFLSGFIPWFSSPTPHHVLVLFENPSEEKPAGGFLGSYADITLASGTVTDVSIRDVADVDSAFKPNIIPPVPLQLETTRFRPADANWFFDFPASASETISMFERSDLYSASGTAFDGAIAVSPKVVSDLLAITGPVTVGTGTRAVTFTADNFVTQTQKIVQNGQATGATYPKQIIRVLAQTLFTNLVGATSAPSSTSTEGAQMASSTMVSSTMASSTGKELLAFVLQWIEGKDVMVYFKDHGFEEFARNYGATGDVYQLPQNFNGEYLAVVNSDINADKSELYVKQDINFDAQIGSDGTMTDHLIINREHTGNTSPYWWYQTTNQDYLQVFVPPGSSLTNENGGIKRTVPAPIDYAKKNYATDPAIAAIETSTIQLFAYPAVSTQEQFGKEVFDLWSRVQKGASTQIVLDYTHHLFAAPASGVQYQFIFEKQAGASGTYQFEIDAPLGYVFAENNLAAYTYSSVNPPGRLAVTLTLQKLNNY